MKRSDERFTVKLPNGMRARIKASGNINGRTMNEEIVKSLVSAFPESEVSGRIIAAARIAIGATQDDIAAPSGISVSTLKRLEAGENIATNNRRSVVSVLEAAGVTFILKDAVGGDGFRLARKKSE